MSGAPGGTQALSSLLSPSALPGDLTSQTTTLSPKAFLFFKCLVSRRKHSGTLESGAGLGSSDQTGYTEQVSLERQLLQVAGDTHLEVAGSQQHGGVLSAKAPSLPTSAPPRTTTASSLAAFKSPA